MTPQGQVGGAPQQSWFSKNWKWLVGLGCGVPVLCCLTGTVASLILGDAAPDVDPILNVGELPSARVDCGEPGPAGVDCVVKRSGGEGALEACWDLEITCQNGGVMSAHACGSLTRGQPATTAVLPAAAFSNQDGCDAPKSGAVVNLSVTAR